MKNKFPSGWSIILAVAVLCGALGIELRADSEGTDKAISTLAEKISAAIRKAGVKKVAVMDFPDLDGKQTALGKYVAEKISVELVEHREGFSVMERANLDSILSEHKLTVEGLVEPANAQALHQFSGVNALVLGKIASLDDATTITARILLTESGEITGASSVKIPKAVPVVANVAQGVPGPASAAQPKAPDPKKPIQKFGDLTVELDSYRLIGPYLIQVDLVLKNTSMAKALGVAMYSLDYSAIVLNSSIVTPDGTEYKCSSPNISGIRAMKHDPRYLTEIGPGNDIHVTLKFEPKTVPARGFTSFRLQAEIVLNKSYSERSYATYRPPSMFQPSTDELPPGCKLNNLSFEISTE
jgi:hypothetical protein